MKRSSQTFVDMETEALLKEYIRIGVAQGEAALYNENAKYTRLFDQRRQIEEELRQRSGDHRRYLLELYRHPDYQVRLNAAKATRSLAPDEARLMLEVIAASREMPYAADAGMSLYTWDEGIWKPE